MPFLSLSLSCFLGSIKLLDICSCLTRRWLRPFALCWLFSVHAANEHMQSFLGKAMDEIPLKSCALIQIDFGAESKIQKNEPRIGSLGKGDLLHGWVPSSYHDFGVINSEQHRA